MTDLELPAFLPNFIAGEETGAAAGECFAKRSPADGRVLTEVARSRANDVRAAIDAARR
jgi:gamma-glutamyl-gamma-aminobutyraldehyde dehydrogenase